MIRNWLKSAISIVFNAKVFGCSFHFGQSVLEKFKILDFLKYKNDREFNFIIKAFHDLTFVPSEKINIEFKNKKILLQYE